ncbi:MAG: phosphatidate cytidylyltransferase [Verrucomicrobia bacterium]|nr:phosphatidate cytidylyltransferase [Verrucomicrobiota bacterium]
MLKQRLQSGIILGAAVIVVSFWANALAVLLILLLICSLGMWEFYKFLDASEIPNFKYLGVLSGIVLITVTWANQNGFLGPDADYLEWATLFAIMFAVLIRQFPQKHNKLPLETISGTLLGVMYVAFTFNFITRIVFGWEGLEGKWPILFMIVVVKLTDVGAYFVGCGIGKHKLIPRISAGKTWEGCIGGILVGLATGLTWYYFSGGEIGPIRFRLHDIVILSILLSVTGIVSDLAESLLKRGAGVKDSSQMIAGMGGLLDVIDSLLFAAPALYVYVHLFL